MESLQAANLEATLSTGGAKDMVLDSGFPLPPYGSLGIPEKLMLLENIPVELKIRPQFVVYRTRERNGKMTKVPYIALDRGLLYQASVNRPDNLRSIEEAKRALQTGRYEGIGFVFMGDDPYTGIDLDNVLDPETGEVDEHATGIVEALNSYTEVSPGGKGLHIITKASLTGLAGNRRGQVEMYDRGRFFTLTGRVFSL